MEWTENTFQIRPAKDFIVSKGRDRLLSLRILSELSIEDEYGSSHDMSSESSEPKNAYDFMKRRRNVTGDPTMKRWNASIRVGNFAAVDGAPLCVR